MAEVSTDIKDIGDKIVGLTLLQAKQLADYLKETHGLEAAAGGAVMMAAAGPAAAAVEEKTEFDVIIQEAGAQKINVIKALRVLMPSLGLADAKALVDGAPKTLKEGAPKAEAEKMKTDLEAAGAKVSLK